MFVTPIINENYVAYPGHSTTIYKEIELYINIM